MCICICLRSLVYCWTNILLNRLELFIANNNSGIRVKENKGRACLSPSLIITIFHLHDLCVLVALSWPCVLPLPCTVQCSFDICGRTTRRIRYRLNRTDLILQQWTPGYIWTFFFVTFCGKVHIAVEAVGTALSTGSKKKCVITTSRKNKCVVRKGSGACGGLWACGRL